MTVVTAIVAVELSHIFYLVIDFTDFIDKTDFVVLFFLLNQVSLITSFRIH